MTLTDFARLVAAMRSKQREYFLRRQPGTHNEARDWERRVDEAVRDILNPPRPGLFGEETKHG